MWGVTYIEILDYRGVDVFAPQEFLDALHGDMQLYHLAEEHGEHAQGLLQVVKDRHHSVSCGQVQLIPHAYVD